MELDAVPPSRAGQFINVLCRPACPLPGARAVDWPEAGLPELTQPELAGRQPLLRRPFSLAGRLDHANGTVELEVIHHVIGVGTAALAELEVGAGLNVMGPLGRGFAILPERPAAVLVGGGAGIPPLLYLAESLADTGKQVVAFAGARSARLLPLTTDEGEPPSQSGWPTMCAGEFARRGAPTAVTTDDGSLGLAGTVDEAFARWLERRPGGGGGLAAYACGPEPMLKNVADLCLANDIPCQLALERHMACGVGTCQGCARKVKADTPAGWQYKLVCTDGPVFKAEELLW
jgi:dihydroorotate dehydrogenase electron transfer subunit